jgi:hypothetical protein
VSRLKDSYRKEVVPALMKEFGYRNVMEVPRLEKIVVNVGVGEAMQNAKALDHTVQDITIITGQRPIVTRAKKSIAGFKLREGVRSGLRSLCGATGCTISWIACATLPCLADAISAASPPTLSMAAATTVWAFGSSLFGRR